jgi:hypothetical protein
MRRKAQVVGIAAMAAGLLALSPALASAHTFVAPGTIAFPGSTEVGKTSKEQVTVVYTYCTVYTTFCQQPGIFQPAVSVTGDFAQTNNCGAVAQTSPAPVPDCVILVTFKPKAPGQRTGTLTVGSDVGGGTQPGTVPLTGTGVAAPAIGGSGTPTKKKCKAKKRSAQIAKKKCKKK